MEIFHYATFPKRLQKTMGEKQLAVEQSTATELPRD